jgi:hypothetical protein
MTISAAEQMRLYRERHPEKVHQGLLDWGARNREKRFAHRRVYKAVKEGTLVRQPCEICGELRVDAHHEDYSKPLDVMWLCKLHHRQIHAKIGPFAQSSAPTNQEAEKAA